MVHKILKLITGIVSVFVFFALLVTPIFAHVVVKPNQVGIGQYQTFTVGVPNEKDLPVTGLRLLIPDGAESVMPNVKPGWTITVKKTGEGESAVVTELSWTGGVIPAGQRDEFLFSAKVPATETTLPWKAYQTYKDGSVVSWDQEPVTNQSDDDREAMEEEGLGPYSQTSVINDLNVSAGSTANTVDTKESSKNTSVLFVSAIAIFIAGVSLWMQFNKREH